MAPRKNGQRAVAQTIGQRPAARTSRDWSARSRGSLSDAQRYTRFVTIMKRTLPLAAGAILVAVIAYSMQPRQQQGVPFTFQSIGKIDNDLAMIKPRLTGQDASGNPFVVTADVAIQDPKNTRRARLKNIEADLTLKNNQWLTATAITGTVDTNANKLWLEGPIALFSDDGYELHTRGAFIDLNKGIVYGQTAISGQGPLGTMRADRFRIEHALTAPKPKAPKGAAPPRPVPKQSPVIYLFGHVHMTIDSHAARKKK